jgi:hypothetical protein|tara:strand:- start:317 stop:544 length:228 start_codon:yes stop_codon:yes gene_type:complete
MSDATAIDNVVSYAFKGDAAQVKTAINDALQQKVMVAFEDKKREIANSFLHKNEIADVEEHPTAEEPATEEVTNG